MAVKVSTEPAFRAEKPMMLFDGPFRADMTGHPSYDVSLDGQKFLMTRRVLERAGQLHIVLNLADELRRRNAGDN